MKEVAMIGEAPRASNPPSLLARHWGALAAVLGGLAWLGVVYSIVTRVPPFEDYYLRRIPFSHLDHLTRMLIEVSHPIVNLWPIWTLLILEFTAILAYLSATARKRTAVAGAIVYGVVSILAFLLARAFLEVALLNICFEYGIP